MLAELPCSAAHVLSQRPQVPRLWSRWSYNVIIFAFKFTKTINATFRT